MTFLRILDLDGILCCAPYSILPSMIRAPTCKPLPCFTPTPLGPLNTNSSPLRPAPEHSFVHFLAGPQPGLTSRAESLGSDFFGGCIKFSIHIEMNPILGNFICYLNVKHLVHEHCFLEYSILYALL